MPECWNAGVRTIRHSGIPGIPGIPGITMI
jgi:hypothetical protein